jgi:hypothetical protein
MSISKYIGRTVVAILALYVIFFGFAVILAVFDSATWDEVWSISGKVGLVALVILAINIVLSVLVGLLPRKPDISQKK